jgi:hypothetical protein
MLYEMTRLDPRIVRPYETNPGMHLSLWKPRDAWGRPTFVVDERYGGESRTSRTTLDSNGFRSTVGSFQGRE